MIRLINSNHIYCTVIRIGARAYYRYVWVYICFNSIDRYFILQVEKWNNKAADKQ